MRCKSFLLFFSLLFFTVARAQVNLQTGAAEQSFPLINYIDGKAGLTLNAGLAYSSGNGLLVGDIPSNLGTGWNLDIGGSIMRMQVGEPDDQKERATHKAWAYVVNNPPYITDGGPAGIKEVWKAYPAGYLFNTNIGKGCNEGLNYYPVFKDNVVYKELTKVAGDTEQDKFLFRMNGHTGVFVIGRDANHTVRFLGDSRLKVAITFEDMRSQGIRTWISQFVVTTEDGLRYTFRDKGLTRLLRYKYSERDANGNWVPKNGNPSGADKAVNRFWGYETDLDEEPFVVNSWYLSEIENPNTGQKISFAYQDVTSQFVAGKHITHQRDLNKTPTYAYVGENQNGRTWFQLLSNPAVAQQYSQDLGKLDQLKSGSISLVYNRAYNLTKRLVSVSMPDGGSLALQYSARGRQDLPGESALERISYSLNGQLLRSYQFRYGYFFKNSILPYENDIPPAQRVFARLCLLSLQKTGTEEDAAYEPPYKFSYYTGSTLSSDDIVPARNYLSQDHWGYYNGANSGLSLSEDHDFLSDENNQYFKTVLYGYKAPKAGYARNGLLKSVRYPTGGTLEYTYAQNTRPGALAPNTPLYTGGVSVSKTRLYDDEDHSRDVVKEYAYVLPNGQSSRWGYEEPVYYNFSVTEYNETGFDKRFDTPGMLYPEMATSTDIPMNWGQALVSAVITEAAKSILTGLLNAIGASAAVPYLNVAYYIYVVVEFLTALFSTQEYHRFVLSNQNLILSNPLPSMVSRVEVKTNAPQGGNGKVVTEFTDLKDYPAIVPELKWPYMQQERLVRWKYGLPKRVRVYDKDNHLVTETTNGYSFQQSIAGLENENCHCATMNKRSWPGYDWDEYDKAGFSRNRIHWLVPQFYFHATGRADLDYTEEKQYRDDQLVYTSQVKTSVDPYSLLQKGKVVLKDANSLVMQLNYYPADYNIPGSALEELKARNAIQLPVATESWMIRLVPDPNNASLTVPELSLLSASVTEFKKYTFGPLGNTRTEIKPWKVYRTKLQSPLAQSVIGTHDPAQLLRKPEYFKLESELVYDDEGNLVQTLADGASTSYINDHKSRHVVATVSNASYGDIAYSSFEADGKGGWDFKSTAIDAGEGWTGSRSLQLVKTSILPANRSSIGRGNLDPAKKYVVSYWYKSTGLAAPRVNSTPPELVYEQGDWKLYRYEFTGASTVSIEGDGKIDEVRLYPAGALMSTVVYRDGIGKVADCDANNRLLFYEYDGLGRLRLVRDQGRNVIKTYEYNYKQ